jgi:hypothetical protein
MGRPITRRVASDHERGPHSLCTKWLTATPPSHLATALPPPCPPMPPTASPHRLTPPPPKLLVRLESPSSSTSHNSPPLVTQRATRSSVTVTTTLRHRRHWAGPALRRAGPVHRISSQVKRVRFIVLGWLTYIWSDIVGLYLD